MKFKDRFKAYIAHKYTKFIISLFQAYMFVGAFIFYITYLLTNNVYIGFVVAGLSFRVFVFIVQWFKEMKLKNKMNIKDVN